ncbi:MAG: DMT family transporter [Tepidimonas sp.]|uniref:DMT family transporter n=1 Tax=Tepidimonas sp. TaxID=2002775 RepID=UPI00298EE60D|nr:DMT family transporter [Tepidimonas sp.]MDW8336353.1 DMT family transporter [Tepidimonas sp.]
MLTRAQALGLVALTLMWGVNWPVMKLSLQELTPLYFRAVTMSGGALWLLAFYRWRGVRLGPAPTEWRSIVTLALPNMLGWHTLAIFGVAALASGRAAILGFTMPVWTVLLGALFFGERLTRRSALAALLVVLAVALLLADELRALAGRPLGVAVMLGAALSWAVGTLMMRRARLTLPLEALTVWMMLLTAAALWLLAAAFEPWPSWHLSPRRVALLAYGVFMNYGFAQIIWFSLARHLPPATSAMSVMMVPLIGTASATVIAGEWPRWTDGVAMVCVMGAIATVLLPPGVWRRLLRR